MGKKAYDYISASSEEKISFDEMGEDLARTNAKTAQEMLQQYEDGTRELTEEQIEALTEQAKGPSQDLLDATNNEIGDQRARIQKQLALIDLERGDAQTMGIQVGPDGELQATYGRAITDASVIAEREADIRKRREEKLAELARIDERVAERIEKGYGTLEQMTKQDPEGFIEGIKYMFSNSAEIIRGREAETQARLDQIINYFEKSTNDDNLTDGQISSIIKRVEEGAEAYPIIQVINKGGDVNQFVDASDKSSTVNKRTLYPNVGAPAAMPTG